MLPTTTDKNPYLAEMDKHDTKYPPLFDDVEIHDIPMREARFRSPTNMPNS